MEAMMTIVVVMAMYVVVAAGALVFMYGASKVSGNFEGDNAEE